MRLTKAAPMRLIFGLWTFPAFAECGFDLAAEEARVAAAKSCGEAHEIYEGCLWGSTADVQRGAMVRKLCEKGFLDKLSSGQKKRYGRRIAACEKKYRNEDGSRTAPCAVRWKRRAPPARRMTIGKNTE